MKKVITILITFVLLLTLAPAAFADAIDDYISDVNAAFERDGKRDNFNAFRVGNAICYDCRNLGYEAAITLATNGNPGIWNTTRFWAQYQGDEWQQAAEAVLPGVTVFLRIVSVDDPDAVYLITIGETVLYDVTFFIDAAQDDE